MMTPAILITLIAAGMAAAGFVYVTVERKRQAGTQAIDSYAWPPGLIERLAEHHPTLTSDEIELVSRGLRQFFRAYLHSSGRAIAMPSRVVDDLWHEFILFTRDYQLFCQRAFGRFLHHVPAVVHGTPRKPGEHGLYHVWKLYCREESIDPEMANRLPLLFAIDERLKIEGGFMYHLDWVRRHRSKGGGCGGSGTSCSGDGSSCGGD